ncbi:MAG: cobalt-precorrin-5B (C(1))-methyltransferase, partial [Oligoflexia bacterium]|nr:cobalt-precorrin-5B (C(1))-methyltransferase [Oligoflexia bacterium]
MNHRKKQLRTGYTTGACAAAAAKAATKVLLLQESTLQKITITLPNREQASFQLVRCGLEFSEKGCKAFASVIKDAGDDPDCTHGAEIVAEVEFLATEGVVEVLGGIGVAKVTKRGLGLALGESAINPVPKKNIIEMVREECKERGSCPGLKITISVPCGEEIAKQTTNARLGLIGGISILGTTGVVRPFSAAAYKAFLVDAIAVAKSENSPSIVLSTGGRSEEAAKKLYPTLPEHAFIQCGDRVDVALKEGALQ